MSVGREDASDGLPARRNPDGSRGGSWIGPHFSAGSRRARSSLDAARTHALTTLLSLLLVAAATVAMFAIDHLIAPYNLVPIVYLVPVVIAATRWGAPQAIVASVAGFLASDYFFYPPFYSFEMENPQEVIDLLLFLFVALVASNLTARLKREADSLRRREKQIRDLHALSRRLASGFTVADLVHATQDYVAAALGRRAILLASPGDEGGHPGDARTVPATVEREAAAMSSAAITQFQTIADPATRIVWLLKSLSTKSARCGVIAVEVGSEADYAIEQAIERAQACIAEVAATIERLDLAKAMGEADVRLQGELLKEALMGAVSHDLRTPLASILGSVSVLDQLPPVRADDRARTLVEAVHDEAIRLDNSILNLLNATRITEQGLRPRLEWADAVDIINAAIKQRQRGLAAHRLRMAIDRDLPLVKVDSALIEQAFGQLLENAAKYSTADSEIVVGARAEQNGIALSVADQGSGLTFDESRQIGQRAYRSDRQAKVRGSGLGLWIANTFVHANGGRLQAVSRGAGLGTTVTIHLPAATDNSPRRLGAANG